MSSSTLNPDIPSPELNDALNDAVATMKAFGQTVLTPSCCYSRSSGMTTATPAASSGT